MNRYESYKNVGDVLDEMVAPVEEYDSLQDALSKLIAPFHLTYIMQDGFVVLTTKEDVEKREKVRKKIAADIDDLLTEDIKPSRLRSAVIIFPLLDDKGKTTHEGTALSILANFRATYLPERIFQLSIPDLAEEYGLKFLYQQGMTISPTDMESIKAQFRARSWAMGKCILNRSGAFHIELNFEGEYGKKTFARSGAKNDLIEVPQWMAGCVYEYCGIELTPQQREYLNRPEFKSSEDIFDFIELESEFINYVNNEGWRRLLLRNPQSIFILYRYFLSSEFAIKEKSFELIQNELAKIGNHDFLKELKGRYYHERLEYEFSIPVFIGLLKKDIWDVELLEYLDKGLLALGLGESARQLHDSWRTNEPDSHIPLLSEGIFYEDYAWDARGGGWSYSVTDEGWEKFGERLKTAATYLPQAYEAEPRDPRAAAHMIIIATGSGFGFDEMEKWYQRSIQADPKQWEAYRCKLMYLKPKWHGSREEMFAYARECAANPSPELRAPLVLQGAHLEMAYEISREEQEWKVYFEDPQVWKELKPMYEKYLSIHPDANVARNYFAKSACYAKDYEEALRQFKLIGFKIDKKWWGWEPYFYTCRAQAYAEVQNKGHAGTATSTASGN